jgi:hypothetical protein
MADLSDGDFDFATHEDRKARKEHRCGECWRTIAKGETYRLHTSCYDHYVCTSKVCAHCQVACRWLSQNCGGWIFEAVREDIHEHVSEYPGLALPLLRLEVGMRRKWRRFDGAGLMRAPVPPPNINVEAHA